MELSGLSLPLQLCCLKHIASLLGQLDVCSFLWQASQDTGTSHNPGISLRLQDDNFTQWPLRASLQGPWPYYALPSFRDCLGTLVPDCVALSFLFISCLQPVPHEWCCQTCNLVPLDKSCSDFCVSRLLISRKISGISLSFGINLHFHKMEWWCVYLLDEWGLPLWHLPVQSPNGANF